MKTKKEMLSDGWTEHKDFWSRKGELGTEVLTKDKPVRRKKIQRIKMASLKPDIYITRESMLKHYREANPSIHEFTLNNAVDYEIFFSNGWTFDGYEGISLSLQAIKKDVRLRNMSSGRNFDFYQCICETLSHEVTHKVIEELEGIETSKRYDRIKNKLRKFGVMA